MTKSLYIAEKPSVAQEFAKALKQNMQRRDGYLESDQSVVTWCVGHLVTMSYPEKYDPALKRWSLETLPFLPENFKYEVIPEVKKQFNIVSGLLHREDIETILKDTPEERQTVLFSATMPEAIRRITRRFMKEPQEVRIQSSVTTRPDISQSYWTVWGMRKNEALVRFLEAEDFDAAIIFVRTKNATLEVAEALERNGYNSAALNGDMNQALREQTEAMGTDPQEFLGYNPFTASIEVKLHSDYANSDSIAKIEKKIKKNTNIQEVLYQKDLIDAVNDNIRNISLMLLGLAVILTFISFALINNTIRLTIYSKRFLIHTMKLVGASWSFIRRPFLRRNFWIGVLSAVIADAVLWGAAYWLVSYEPELIRVITPDVMLLVSVSVLIFGVLITWLCALLSINKYLKMKAGTLYYI